MVSCLDIHTYYYRRTKLDAPDFGLMIGFPYQFDQFVDLNLVWHYLSWACPSLPPTGKMGFGNDVQIDGLILRKRLKSGDDLVEGGRGKRLHDVTLAAVDDKQKRSAPANSCLYQEYFYPWFELIWGNCFWYRKEDFVYFGTVYLVHKQLFWAQSNSIFPFFHSFIYLLSRFIFLKC